VPLRSTWLLLWRNQAPTARQVTSQRQPTVSRLQRTTLPLANQMLLPLQQVSQGSNRREEEGLRWSHPRQYPMGWSRKMAGPLRKILPAKLHLSSSRVAERAAEHDKHRYQACVSVCACCVYHTCVCSMHICTKYVTSVNFANTSFDSHFCLT